MIQRIQSIWLFLAAACSVLSFQFPFYSGNLADSNQVLKFTNLNASFNFVFIILTAIQAGGLLFIIFLFKNRKLQFRLSLATFLESILLLVLYFFQVKKFADGYMALPAVIYFAIPVFILLAAINIRKDERLVKSMDRLR